MPRPTDRTMPLFVYGTLRPEQRLWDMIRASVLTATPARLSGFALFNVFPGNMPVYPVMIPHDGAKVVGTLLMVRDGRQLRAVHAMEIGAGYDLRTVHLESPQADGPPVAAAAFVYPHRGRLGWRVPGDDWSTALEPTASTRTSDRRARTGKVS